MSTIRRLWVPVLVAALVAMVIGPGMVTAAEPRVVTRKIMIPAAAFIPNTDDLDYSNSGYMLELFSGSGAFTAPLAFPEQTVKIRKLTLYAYDNSPGKVSAYLSRTSPPNGSIPTHLGQVSTSDSPDNPQAPSTTVISPRWVNTAIQGLYLWLYINAPGVTFYGVAITYSY